MKSIATDKNFCGNFMDKLMANDNKNSFTKFQNFDNMVDFSNILTTISLKFDSNKNDNFGVNLVVIYISEKTYYHEKKNNRKIYLCSLMSKNPIYSSKVFWNQLMDTKLLLLKIDPIKSTKIENGKIFFHKLIR